MTQREVDQLADLLGRLEVGFLPPPIFIQIARLVALPIIEIVPLRLDADGEAEVLLTRRPADDPTWPGLLHTPGTVIRATDRSFVDGMDRILGEELMGISTGPPIFVGNAIHRQGRGTEFAAIYFVEVKGDPGGGDGFYKSSELPRDLVQSQRGFIDQAVRLFGSKAPSTTISFAEAARADQSFRVRPSQVPAACRRVS
jgi:hypothetical protein